MAEGDSCGFIPVFSAILVSKNVPDPVPDRTVEREPRWPAPFRPPPLQGAPGHAPALGKVPFAQHDLVFSYMVSVGFRHVLLVRYVGFRNSLPAWKADVSEQPDLTQSNFKVLESNEKVGRYSLND